MNYHLIETSLFAQTKAYSNHNRKHLAGIRRGNRFLIDEFFVENYRCLKLHAFCSKFDNFLRWFEFRYRNHWHRIQASFLVVIAIVFLFERERVSSEMIIRRRGSRFLERNPSSAWVMPELHVFAASSRNAGDDLDSDAEITDTESLSEFPVRACDIFVFLYYAI